MPIDYQNVEIEISRSVSGDWEVRLLESPLNRPRERFVFEDRLEIVRRKVTALEAILLDRTKTQERDRLATDIGTDLYEMLLPGKVGSTFERSITLLDEYRNHEDKGLRLRLSFGGNDDFDHRLVNLPWELLCDPETGNFITDQPQTPLVRYLDLSRREKPIQASPPLKILAVLASPKHPKLSPVDTEAHRQILKTAQKDSKWLDLRFSKPTLEDLHRTLDKHRQQGAPFHVLHFLGHGQLYQGHGCLCLEDDKGGLDLVRGSDLARQLEPMAELRLAVLATCHGAKMYTEEGHNPFHGVASSLVATRMPAVVGMQFSVTEGAAAEFTSTFYTTLGNNRCVDVDEAMAEARRRILRYDTKGLEWATPVLFLRSPTGYLLNLEGAIPQARKISVFNIEGYGEDELEVGLPVDLRDYFYEKKNRAYIQDPKHWNGGVLDTLKEAFTGGCLNTGVPYHLEFAAPISVAFAVGYLLEAKSDYSVTAVGQRGVQGSIDPWSLEGKPSPGAASWLPEVDAQKAIPEDFPIADRSSDVAVAVGLSRSVLDGVAHYLETNPNAPKISHVIHAVLSAGTGQATVENGPHAVKLAEDLAERIHEELSRRGRPRIHVFMAVPNTFAFLIGRLAKAFPEIQLYEFDFTGGDTKGYQPSILLR